MPLLLCLNQIAQTQMRETVLKRPTDRRTVLIVAGVAALAAATGTSSAQTTDLVGEIRFTHDTVIPAGQIEVYLEDLAVQDRALRRVAETRVNSDGASKMIGFSLSRPASLTDTPTLQIVVRLQRADGWLIARGSTPIDVNAPVQVTLNEVMY